MSADDTMGSDCGACGRAIDMAAGEAAHYPCYWGCPEPIRTLRETKPDVPICIDCLPARFKVGNAHWKPVLSAADLPKVGERVPPNTVFVPSIDMGDSDCESQE